MMSRVSPKKTVPTRYPNLLPAQISTSSTCTTSQTYIYIPFSFNYTSKLKSRNQNLMIPQDSYILTELRIACQQTGHLGDVSRSTERAHLGQQTRCPQGTNAAAKGAASHVFASFVFAQSKIPVEKYEKNRNEHMLSGFNSCLQYS